MRARLLLAASVLASLAPAAPGNAGACPSVTDDRGDSTPLHYGTSTPVDESFGAKATDILSADVWTDSNRITGIIRLAEVPTTPAVPRSHGHQWWLRLQAEGGAIILYAIENNGYYEYNALWSEIIGTQDANASAPVNLHNTTGTLNPKTGEIRLSAPLAMFAPYTKVSRGVHWTPSAMSFVVFGAPAKRAAFGNLSAYLGPGGLGSEADSAAGTTAITVGRPDCAS